LNARKADNTRDNSFRECANTMGKQIFTALEEAISSGHGHASPLRMTVYAGSESGRHRSVLVCELGATALRKLLRSNEQNQITQPVSVGTRHRDIDRRQREMEQTGVSKQKELESEL
jgi:RNase adaptor protein for sRNA GlmZ degradation